MDITDWSLAIGWDEESGGLLNFVDYAGFPSPFLEWDMKLWWVHREALCALLFAYHLTSRTDLFEWFERVRAWFSDHFPDPQHGE